MQHPAQVFVNVFENAKAECLEAHDGVYETRTEAAEAAEQYADSYLFTLTGTGKIDLRSEFSEAYQERVDFDAAVDAKIDDQKKQRFARERR